jgi:hypothetical protein
VPTSNEIFIFKMTEFPFSFFFFGKIGLSGAKCLPNQAHCANGECLDIEKFCDGHWDCSDDEYSCSNKTLCDELKCSYNCKVVGNTPRCYCPAGRQPNGTQCIDIDECLAEPCEQKCTNTDSSYKCGCVAGYIKVANMCRALNCKCFYFFFVSMKGSLTISLQHLVVNKPRSCSSRLRIFDNFR